ncbi:MAG TPA: response regulator [Gammaproteobacteria bacterium]|nr:response regulator [Gammaproteobacteria bacterium]
MSEPNRVLIVDDDAVFCEVLSRALRRREFETRQAHNARHARELAALFRPQACVLDLKLGEDSGLALVPELMRCLPGLRILVLTGYASIATAVEAVKLGAADYLAKPAGPDRIVSMLCGRPPADMQAREAMLPPSVRRLEWEHIQRVLNEHGGNISGTARALGMHRRTLQRKLAKKPVPR